MMFEGEQKWNLNLIKHSFSLEEAHFILGIPLTKANREDKLVWAYTSNGVHSVKSAYHLHNTWMNKNQGVSSTGTGKKQIWKHIWNLNVANGVKSFLWRACKEILPTCLNLYRRKILQDSLLPHMPFV